MDVEESIGVESIHELQRRRTCLLVPPSPPPPPSTVTWESITAGYVAGMCGVLVGHPLDSVKVWIQMQLTRGSQSAATNATSVNPIAWTWRNLYAGVQGPLLTIGLVQALNFGVYDACRRHLYYARLKHQGEQQQQRQQQQQIHQQSPFLGDDYILYGSLVDVAIASSIAGMAISIPTSILQATKIHQQVHSVWSWWSAANTLYTQHGGIRAFFKGMGPHLYCQALGRMVYVTSYESLKRQWMAINSSNNNHDNDNNKNTPIPYQLALPERMLCASISGMLCWTFTYPADVLRCRLYAQTGNSHGKTLGTLEMARYLYYQEGGGSFRPFVRGLGVTVLRAAPVSAAVLPVYDMVLAWLSNDDGRDST